jgi:hypothetical protein
VVREESTIDVSFGARFLLVAERASEGWVTFQTKTDRRRKQGRLCMLYGQVSSH